MKAIVEGRSCIYRKFFKVLKLLGIFPYHFDERQLKLCPLLRWREKKTFVPNVVIGVAIFLKQRFQQWYEAGLDVQNDVVSGFAVFELNVPAACVLC